MQTSDAHGLRDGLSKEFAALRTARAEWDPIWSDVRRHTRTQRSRFDLSRKHSSDADVQGSEMDLLDTHARKASRILRSGLHGGMTSPSRPWFKLGLPDRDLMDDDAVGLWLHQCEAILRDIFRGSNTYSSLQQGYGEAGDFATSAMFVVRDRAEVIRCYPMEIGEYWLGADERGVANTCYRRCRMTVDQVVREFGLDNVSENTRTRYDRSNYHDLLDVVRVVKPRRARDPDKVDALNMPVMVGAYEENAKTDEILHVGGGEAGLLNVARWEVSGYEPYGIVSPGMDALADTRQLQYYALRKAEAVDNAIRPPMMGPTSLATANKQFFPGGITYVDDLTLQKGGLRPIHESRADIGVMLEDVREQRSRVDSDYFVDLFMMFNELDRRQITAEEVIRRHEEKLIMLGPVLDLLGRERLQPFIARAFAIANEGGLIPEAPPAIQGMPLQVEYISTLAQAQKAVGVGPIERTIGFIGTLAELDPSVLHRMNADEALEEFTELVGAPPKMLRSKDEAEGLRQAEAEAAEGAAAMSAMEPMARSAALLSEASERGVSALQRAGVA